MKFTGLLLLMLTASVASAQRVVTFPLGDQKQQVEADLYGTGDRAVILAHGGRWGKSSWAPQAKAMAAAGFMVLAVRYRGDVVHPDGTESADGKYEDNTADVLAAVRYCHSLGAKTVSAVGGSLGGYAVADADVQAGPGGLDRIVILAAPGGSHPERLTGRKLFVVAREDRDATSLRLPEIQQSYDKAPEPKRLLILEGSAHAQYLFTTSQGPQLLQTILAFLSAP